VNRRGHWRRCKENGRQDDGAHRPNETELNPPALVKINVLISRKLTTKCWVDFQRLVRWLTVPAVVSEAESANY